MWFILQQDSPDDYVIATGETHSVREFVELAFAKIGLPILWCGQGINEKGYDARSGKILVESDPDKFRPTEVDVLLGDSTKARNKLGWEPKVKFEELVAMMVEADLESVQKCCCSRKYREG
jgi:GDPmannose 4,6-dehydratase